MSYGSYNVSATVYVKGGMPLEAEGVYSWDDSVGWAGVEDIVLYWSNTGKPVSKGFADSLSASDWDNVAEALAESRY